MSVRAAHHNLFVFLLPTEDLVIFWSGPLWEHSSFRLREHSDPRNFLLAGFVVRAYGVESLYEQSALNLTHATQISLRKKR